MIWFARCSISLILPYCALTSARRFAPISGSVLVCTKHVVVNRRREVKSLVSLLVYYGLQVLLVKKSNAAVCLGQLKHGCLTENHSTWERHVRFRKCFFSKLTTVRSRIWSLNTWYLSMPVSATNWMFTFYWNSNVRCWLLYINKLKLLKERRESVTAFQVGTPVPYGGLWRL